MINKKTIGILSFGHGLNDLLAGYFLGCLIQQNQNLLQVGMGLMVYNLLAFGGQFPVALWMEKFRNPKGFLLAAYSLNVSAAALYFFLPQLSIVLLGVASAAYHVAGGTICARENKAVHIGWFAAPGVAGLIAGGYFAWQGLLLTSMLIPAAMLFLFILSRLGIPDKSSEKETSVPKAKLSPDRHDIIMILLLTVISLRSAVWNIFQLIHENNYEWLLAIAVSAFIGKIVGGWLADRIGWRLYIFISLFTAAPLLGFFRNEIVLFCIGVALLQSGIPATTTLMIQSVRGKTERGISLSFGTAIMAGTLAYFIPAGFFHTGWLILPGVIFVIVVLMLLSGIRAISKNQISGPV